MAGQSVSPAQINPYVGGHPFTLVDQKHFFGRERELDDLFSLVVSHRCVLLYGRSGVGKSSLVNAGLIPRLESDDFEVMPVLRLRTGDQIARSKEGKDDATRVDELEELIFDLKQGSSHNDRTDPHDARFLMIDQLENVVVHGDTARRFFTKIAELLEDDKGLRILFAIREEYVGSLDSLSYLLPGELRIRLRLEGLRRENALAALVGPLQLLGADIEVEVAKAIVDDLCDGNELVGPTQLQIVGADLWKRLQSSAGEISGMQVDMSRDLNTSSLVGYYESVLGEAVRNFDVREDRLRRWFEKKLMTPVGTRSIVSRGPTSTEGIPNRVVDFLEHQHLIRGELRVGSQWYELAHDRLLEPVRQSNASRRSRLTYRRIAGVVLVLLVALAVWVARAYLGGGAGT
jgi:hypothetical protein